MTSSLFTPDLRRILTDLGNRIGVLERRVNPTAAAAAQEPVPYVIEVGIEMGGDLLAFEKVEFVRDPASSGTVETSLTIPGGPKTLSASNLMYPVVFNPLKSGVLKIYIATLIVYNPAVTERLKVNYSNTVVDPDSSWNAAATGTTVSADPPIGTDLSLGSGANAARAKTTAGGIFLANLNMILQYTPV